MADNDRRVTRRDCITHLAAAIGTPLLVGLNAPALLAAPADPSKWPTGKFTGYTYINKLPSLTMDEMIDRYEHGHVPSALKSPMRFFYRYSRNYILRYSGVAPGFDCLMESSPTADFPMDIACGHPMDSNWKSVVGGAVEETVLHGPAWSYEAGPVRKQGYIIRTTGLKGPARTAAIQKFARAAANRLAPHAHRIILAVQGPTRDPHRCVEEPQPIEAILMVWPKGEAKLPDHIAASRNVSVPTAIELVNYSSNVPFKAGA